MHVLIFASTIALQTEQHINKKNINQGSALQRQMTEDQKVSITCQMGGLCVGLVDKLIYVHYYCQDYADKTGDVHINEGRQRWSCYFMRQ